MEPSISSSAHPRLTFDPKTIEAAAVGEAISSLGYLTPASRSTLLSLLPLCETQHPKAVAGAWRKSDPQMSSEAKRAIGVRANGLLSQAALDELTEAGRKLPLKAHEITLLRAHFTVARARSIVQALDAGLEIRIDGSFADRCPVCKATQGTTLAPDAVDPFPPKDCQQDGCAMHLVPWKDYFAGFDKSEGP